MLLNPAQFNSARELPNETEIREKGKKAFVHGIILYLNYPFLLWFGCYRLFKPKDFRCTLYLGYLMELSLNLIPLAFIQATTNNTLKEKDMNQLQTFALVLTVLTIFEIVA